MDIIAGLVRSILEEGFIYGIVAVGVYITYRVLGFPDLSVDGSFPLGSCVTAALITAGFNPWLTCLTAFLCGAAAGSMTGLLHVRLKISDLLSGILTMITLWSVNLAVTGGRAVVQFYGRDTIYTAGPAALLSGNLRTYRTLIVAALVCIAVKLLLDGYLKTGSGLLLRAAGDNPQYVVSLGSDPGKMKILGLAVGNGCTALAGSVLAQQAESANIQSGTGMVVMALASVIIGSSLFGRLSFIRATTAAVLGSIVYKACLSAAMQMGLPTNYLKALMAVLFTAALVSNSFFADRRKKRDAKEMRP
jgi:putative ABC transport system permease protein